MFKLAASLLLTLPLLAQAADARTFIKVQEKDPEMVAAIERARASLDEFLAINAKPPKEASDFRLKVMVQDENGTEHLWVTPFKSLGQDRFKGIISNQPRIVDSVEGGQEYEFSRAQISDWGYVKDGRQIGSYTVCALFKQMSKAEVKFYREKHGFECKD
ncbi:YegJ family protein [Chitinimonas lacunae]|uniref:YegJ family protein n=1 Tax=Chitinimonas lacunae TaxID=1963018 RepID=A0ABV8MNE7_9NEIS